MTLTDNLETARRSGAESLGKVVTVTEKPVSTTSSIQSSFAMRGFFHLFIWCLPLTGLAFAQADQGGPDKVPDAIAKDAVGRIKQGIILQADVDRLAAAGAVQVIPELKEQFALSQDEVGKGRLASALVKLGDKDVTYWDYLVKEARSAIESDTPSPMQFDSKGAFIKGPSPEFIAWAKARNVTTDSALEAAMYRLPSKVVFLGATGDRRAVPLLRQSPVIRQLHDPDFRGSRIGKAPGQSLDTVDHRGLPKSAGGCGVCHRSTFLGTVRRLDGAKRCQSVSSRGIV